MALIGAHPAFTDDSYPTSVAMAVESESGGLAYEHSSDEGMNTGAIALFPNTRGTLYSLMDVDTEDASEPEMSVDTKHISKNG